MPRPNDGGGAPGKMDGAPDDQDKPKPDGGGNDPNLIPPKKESTRTVSYENHQRALDDMHDFKRRTVAAEQALEDLKAEKLREDKNYEALYEGEKEKRVTAETKLAKTNETFLKTQKFNAVRVEAIKKGLIATEDLSSLALDDVQVDVIEGAEGTRFEVRGADSFVENLVTTRPHWFSSKKPPAFNPGGGGKPPAGTKITAADVFQAEQKAKRGEIPQSKYLEMHTAFSNQQKEASG